MLAILAGATQHHDAKRCLQLKTRLEFRNPSQSPMNYFLVELLRGRNHLDGKPPNAVARSISCAIAAKRSPPRAGAE